MGRLALARGGEAIDSPYEWWDSLPQSSVDFWQAYYKIEPWGGDWHRHAQKCLMLDRIALRVAKGDGETIRPPSDYMPADHVELEYATDRKPSVGEQLSAVAKVHSGNND